MIATSGTVGDWIDIASLPTALGSDLTDILMKWQAYKKQGIAIYDSSQEGANLINTSFNGYDDTIKAQSIQAVQMAIDSIEAQASSITGVFQEKLGGIQQRDAVSNVKVGVRQSTLLTKQYFSAMDLMYKEVNYDLLNMAKIAYKDGLSGILVLGNRLSKVFNAMPEHYTMTDFDIHIQDSTEILQVKETITNAGIELVKSGQADAAMIINMTLAKNVRELKDYIEKAVAEKKAENDQLGQMQQQIQQYEQQMKDLQNQLQQAQSQVEQAQKQVEKNNQDKLAIEQQRVQVEQQKADDTRNYNDKLVELKKRQVDLEFLQLSDGNPYNDEIRDV